MSDNWKAAERLFRVFTYGIVFRIAWEFCGLAGYTVAWIYADLVRQNHWLTGR